jgi:hypothetical protein
VTGVTDDIENRMLTAAGKTYRYSQSGQRIYMNSGTAQGINYYGVDGRKLGTYQPAINIDYVSFTTLNKNVYFNGRAGAQQVTVKISNWRRMVEAVNRVIDPLVS